MKNDFAFIRAPGGHFQLVTPHTDHKTGEADPRRHDITRLEAEMLVEDMLSILGGWVPASKACKCPPDKSCHT